MEKSSNIQKARARVDETAKALGMAQEALTRASETAGPEEVFRAAQAINQCRRDHEDAQEALQAIELAEAEKAQKEAAATKARRREAAKKLLPRRLACAQKVDALAAELAKVRAEWIRVDEDIQALLGHQTIHVYHVGSSRVRSLFRLALNKAGVADDLGLSPGMLQSYEDTASAVARDVGALGLQD